jgi:hypothetical protein
MKTRHRAPGPRPRRKAGLEWTWTRPPTVRAQEFSTTAVILKSWGPRFAGEVAEWSIAAVLKTAGPKGPGGSNPSLSASLRQAYGWQAIYEIPTMPSRGGGCPP